jgi:hypothetical protein
MAKRYEDPRRISMPGVVGKSISIQIQCSMGRRILSLEVAR